MCTLYATHLEEYFTEYPVGFFPEHGGEYDGNAVGGCLYVDDLFVSVVEGHEVALAVACCLELFLRLEAKFKRCCECVALEQRQ